MDAIKIFLMIILFIPTLFFGQESKYPKDSIYILFDKDKHIKKELNHPELGKNLYFNNIGVYYNYQQKIDTLCLKHLKDYKFLTLKQIRKKEWEYYKKRFGGSPIISNKNWVFHTFLIEIISNDYFVIYPVMWRNEGY